MTSEAPLVVGRYAIHDEIAAGGMATVHFGRLLGPAGFSRTVAIKRLHASYARDPEFVAMFLDEARLAGRVRHPNVVSMLDVVATQGELFLVMDYVLGDSVARLLRAARRRDERMPVAVVSAIVSGALHGLHAAHEAHGERGEPLDIVHRDVSPQNVLVGLDGLARVVDFGVAKATGRLQNSRDGQLKGKIAYMAPEQVRAATVDRRTDVYAASVMLWEMLTDRRLFDAESEAGIMGKILEEPISPPSHHAGELPAGLDALVLRGLERRRERRFSTAREMALALEELVRPALASDVGAWVERVAGDVLHARSARVAEIESASTSDPRESAQALLSGSANADAKDEATIVDPPRAQVAATPPSPGRPSRRAWMVAAALGVALAAGSVFLFATRAPANATSGVASPSASAVVLAPATTTMATSAESVPSASASIAVTTQAAAPSASAPTKPAVKAVTAGAKKPASKGALPANCRTIDAAGIWHIDPKCL